MKIKHILLPLSLATAITAGVYYNKEIKHSIASLVPAQYQHYIEQPQSTQQTPSTQPIAQPAIDYDKIIDQKLEQKLQQTYGKFEQTIDQKVKQQLDQTVTYRVNALELKVNAQNTTPANLPSSATETKPVQETEESRFGQAYTETVDILKKRIAKPFINDLINSTDNNISNYLEPNQAAQRAYTITVENIDNFDVTQLATLEQTIKQAQQRKLSTQEYSSNTSAYCVKSLAIFDQTQLLTVTTAALPKLSDENYTAIIKEKPLSFWLDHLNKSYGVQFSSPTKGGQ